MNSPKFSHYSIVIFTSTIPIYVYNHELCIDGSVLSYPDFIIYSLLHMYREYKAAKLDSKLWGLYNWLMIFLCSEIRFFSFFLIWELTEPTDSMAVSPLDI